MTRMFAIAVAVVANAAALATVDASMSQILERERPARSEPARIVVVDKRIEPALVTVQNCPAASRGML